MIFGCSPYFCFLIIISMLLMLGCNEKTETQADKSSAFVEKDKQSIENIAIAPASNASVSVNNQNKVMPLLARKYACLNCHAIDKKKVGPAWRDIATRYGNDPNATKILFTSIFKGSQGKWSYQGGNLMMPPHSYIKEEDITQLVTFILSLNE